MHALVRVRACVRVQVDVPICASVLTWRLLHSAWRVAVAETAVQGSGVLATAFLAACSSASIPSFVYTSIRGIIKENIAWKDTLVFIFSFELVMLSRRLLQLLFWVVRPPLPYNYTFNHNNMRCIPVTTYNKTHTCTRIHTRKHTHAYIHTQYLHLSQSSVSVRL